ncbi:MAG: IS1595 family transposase [Acidobacteria bacterium]|nr:MAG: IS1595 family transposase [Acidobacteriota bacterium]
MSNSDGAMRPRVRVVACYRWRCRGCKQMFTVRTGTIFEESRLPLRVWVYAFWKACSSKKGISALQLSREMEITHKSALFVLRRIRHGLGSENAPKLTGTIEADETYVGGRPRRFFGYTHKHKTGRGTHKVPVMGVVQRGGDVRFRLLDRLTSDRLSEVLAENADLTCRLITDEYVGYQGVGKAFQGGHEAVKHAIGEYVRKETDVHSNTIEGVFSQYWWPGNVRQLKNEIQRAVALSAPGGTIEPPHLSPEIASPRLPGASTPSRPARGDANLASAVEQVERDMIQAALDRAAGNISETARALGLTRRGLYLKLRRLGLDTRAEVDTR